MCVHVCPFPSPTDEEDGEGDEEQEDMGNQVESVHEAAIVQHARVHAVGVDTRVVAAKRQGHATAARLLHASLESICENKTIGSHNTNKTQDAKISQYKLYCVLYDLMFPIVPKQLAICVTSRALV